MSRDEEVELATAKMLKSWSCSGQELLNAEKKQSSVGQRQWRDIAETGRAIRDAEEELGEEEDLTCGRNLASPGVQKMSTQTFIYYSGKKDEPGVWRLGFQPLDYD